MNCDLIDAKMLKESVMAPFPKDSMMAPFPTPRTEVATKTSELGGEQTKEGRGFAVGIYDKLPEENESGEQAMEYLAGRNAMLDREIKENERFVDMCSS